MPDNNETTDCQNNKLDNVFDLFQSHIDGLSCSSARNYRKALAYLRGFTRSDDISFSNFTLSFLEDWYVHMYMCGLSQVTAAHYLDNVNSLYNAAVRAGAAAPTDAFGNLKARLRQLGDDIHRRRVTEEDFGRLLNVIRTADRQTGQTALATDLLRLSLLNRCMSPGEIARLQKKDIPGFDAGSQAIAARHADSRRKYIFPLSQATLTPRQLSAAVNRLIVELFSMRGLPLADSIQQSVKALWAYAALRCGAKASQVCATLEGSAEALPVLSLCSGSDITDPQRQQLADAVARVFAGNPLQWFAMRLRRGATFGQIERRLAAEHSPIPELFYPCQAIASRIGRRLVYNERPLISDIVFFRSRITDIYPLFLAIGDLAWCYTTGRGRDSSYAAIPDSDMQHFQRTIGQFTADYQIAPAGALTPRRGERVAVIGGIFAGHTGTFDKTDPADNTIYRILLPDNNGIEWRIRVDSRLVRQA